MCRLGNAGAGRPLAHEHHGRVDGTKKKAEFTSRACTRCRRCRCGASIAGGCSAAPPPKQPCSCSSACGGRSSQLNTGPLVDLPDDEILLSRGSRLRNLLAGSIQCVDELALKSSEVEAEFGRLAWSSWRNSQRRSCCS